MTENSNLVPFPRLNHSPANSPEFANILDGISTLLRTADQLTQLAARANLDDARKLQLVQKLRIVVAEASSLYLIIMNDDEEARRIRTQIESIIETLDKA